MHDLLSTDAVLARLEAPTKKQVLLDMARHAAKVLQLDEHIIFSTLWEREQLGTTGVGHGIAIPHGRIVGLSEVKGFFARLVTPVPFEAVDDRPVDLVFLLLAPESAGADHLHALATVSRLLRNAPLCEELRHAEDTAELYRLITTTPLNQAA